MSNEVLVHGSNGAGGGKAGAVPELGAMLLSRGLIKVPEKKAEPGSEAQPVANQVELEARFKASGLVSFASVNQGTPTEQFSRNAWSSFKYSAVQVPLDGVAELSDHAFETSILPHVQVFEKPHPEPFGSPGWHGQILGSTLGTASQLAAFYRLIGPGASSKLQLTNSYKLGAAALPSLTKSAISGAVYSGIFQPVGGGEDFVERRVANGLAGFATGLTLSGSSIALKSSGSKLLASDITAGALSGIPAGIVNANVNSLLQEKRIATRGEVKESVATYMLGGGILGAANSVHETIRPTSGIRGVRTLTDMRGLADQTRVQDYHSLNAAEQLPPRNHAQLFLKTVRSLSGTPLSNAEKVLIARGHRDLVDSFEQLKPTGKTVTVYGSARLEENSFAYQRARYTAGRLAQNGWSIMTGGGEKGIMRAANQGAYEAGGRSIGVNVELPFEQKPNPFQTVSLEHKNFFTRKEALRKADAFIIEEGGLGTLDEAMEVLTLSQTGKIQKRPPIYFVGRDTYAPMETLLKTLVKHGTVSPEDMSLFKIVDDPNVIVKDLNGGS